MPVRSRRPLMRLLERQVDAIRLQKMKLGQARMNLSRRDREMRLLVGQIRRKTAGTPVRRPYIG